MQDGLISVPGVDLASVISGEGSYTFSAWIKRGTGTGSGPDYIYAAHDGSDYFALYFRYNEIYSYFSPGNNYGQVNARKLRDTTSWFHLVHQVDATNTTQNIWINGEALTCDSDRNPGNSNYPMNESGVDMYVGKASWRDDNVDGYMAEVNHIDGSLIAPTEFGFTDPVTNIWMPKRYEGTYGTNGFYLDFSDNSSITNMCLDKSGNGNHFSPDNCNVEDSTLDTPSNTFATLNPKSTSVNTLSNGNLYSTGGGGSWRPVSSDMAMSSGRWYWEIYIDTVSSYQMHGIRPQIRDDGDVNHDNDHYPGTRSDEWGYNTDARLHNSASATSSWGDTYTVGDIIGVALDMDAGTLNFYKNGSATGSQITGISASHSPSGSRGDYLACFCVYGSTGQAIVNFGQEGTFDGHKTAQNNTDINGIGNFFYTPPTGFKALCSANLRGDSSYIIEPQKHFDVITYTGSDTSSARTVTGLEFAPDLVWQKRRNGTNWHTWHDTVRGGGKTLYSNDTSAEATNNQYGYVSAFTSVSYTHLTLPTKRIV